MPAETIFAFARGEFDRGTVIEHSLSDSIPFLSRGTYELAERLGWLTIAASVPLTIDGDIAKFVPTGVSLRKLLAGQALGRLQPPPHHQQGHSSLSPPPPRPLRGVATLACPHQVDSNRPRRSRWRSTERRGSSQ